MIDNPLAADTDFTVTTCVVQFNLAKQYQQAGLLLYNDDDNYVKWVYEFNDSLLGDWAAQTDPATKKAAEWIKRLEAPSAPKDAREKPINDRTNRFLIQMLSVQYSHSEQTGRPFFHAVAETNGTPRDPIAVAAESKLPQLWLRIRKRGNLYDCLTSIDGRHFIKRGTLEWGKGGPKQIGLIAQNGPAPEIEAHFEYFELRAP